MREEPNMNSCLDFSYFQLEKRSPIFSLPDIVGKKYVKKAAIMQALVSQLCTNT